MAAAPDVDSEAKTSTQTFKIGTRASLLAKVQTNEVVNALKKAWPDYHYEIVAMTTTGDNNQKTALHKFNEKALWTQELEVLLQSGDLDLIVHSLKDMPTQLPHDLDLGCVTKRQDPRDALVIKPTLVDKYRSLAELPEGSVVGTSSLRRIAQLKKHYTHLKFTDVRGNVGTRLAKLDNPESEYSAIILAAAGLARLGMDRRVTTYLSKDNGGMLHAVGQGALGIETRKGDQRVNDLLSKICCERTMRQGLAERSLMRTLEGGCSVPIGIETEWVSKRSFSPEGSGIGVKPAEDYHKLTGVAVNSPENSSAPLDAEEALSDELVMRAIVVSLDGQEAVEVETRKLLNSREDADQFGWEAARLLVDKGAKEILEAITLNRGIIHEQGDA
ncbi:porphobilinogen deaminase [Saxophila tyrrhenica]|uniref:Porphobilinogen deaminase n=1 Tax=Saxophila tyrrhenica TaxID=1690608 RepID=A0AAV9P4Y5_9PEZI|nr:porphobilinogen deaminase [Saxophila tyrrhenica]